jgi:ribosomal-protein-alanine N-acetyltransferase
MALFSAQKSARAAVGEPVVSHALVADVGEIDRIEQAAFSTPWSRDLIRSAILNRRYLVRILRDAESRVTGFYIAHTVDGRSNLDNLAVEVGARRQGWGRCLVTDWILQVRRQSLSSLTLQVNTGNWAAQRLYRQFRFKPTRLLVGYYPNGEDAYQMEMPLAAASAGSRPEAHAAAAD